VTVIIGNSAKTLRHHCDSGVSGRLGLIMGAIGYSAPMIMFNHALTTLLISMTPFITIKGAIKNIQLTYHDGTIMGATYRRNNQACRGYGYPRIYPWIYPWIYPCVDMRLRPGCGYIHGYYAGTTL